MGFAEGGIGHARRDQDFLLDQPLKALALHIGYRSPRQTRAIVGIGHHLAWLTHPAGLFLAQVEGQGPHTLPVPFVQLAQRSVLETAGVGHQIAQAHRGLEPLILQLQPFWQVEVDRCVQPHPARANFPLQGNPGEGLGDRADPEQGAVRIDGAARADAVDAIALAEHNLPVLDHYYRGPSQVIVCHGGVDHAVDIGLQLHRIDGGPSGWRENSGFQPRR